MPQRLLQVVVATGIVLAGASGCAQVTEPAAPAPAEPVRAPGAAAPQGARSTAEPAAPGQRGSGRLTVTQWPSVVIDRKELRAAPGARIVGANNLTVTPNMVPADTRVTYELDALGNVRTIWLQPAGTAGERSGGASGGGPRN